MICLSACVALVGCGDPLADFPRLSEQDLPEDAATVDIAATAGPENTNVLAQLLGAAQPSEAAVPDTVTEDSAEPATATAQPQKSGLFAFFTRAAPAADTTPVEPTTETPSANLALAMPGDEPAQVETASLSPPSEPAADAKRKGFNLFGGAAKPDVAAVSEIAPGTVLPYGKVARICGLSKSQMGKKVAQFPESRPRHKIYDGDPGNTAPHSFFITGFADGCARQFTASLAMFGSVAMHEQLRYGLPAEVQPYSDTDKAYDKLKSRICGVPRKKPCGAKLARLENNTVFVSIYERFGSNSRWKNLLLHDGEMVATDIKGG
ncbi:hypothetical protein EI983_16160 [Roseovarius faecimaris]|uniref:Uncharacterized protein n=1 Tax=Roseovarius faecimaris TaxID=2494550 RepID=A0A6I6IWA8_9RHOB|nr:hypothetical protein [Roseovarius faecimaris]QGX99716.1 hypothetical protein EI983_16160 [Roseovarius faecimaris]